MGFYDVDYSNAGAEQVTPGTYEVYVSDYTISTASSGNTQVSLFYTVRDDVSQQHQGAKIQYDRFVETQNSKWRWDTAAKAAGIPDGTKVQSASDWANLMVNRDIKVKVEMGAKNNQGKSYPEVKAFYQTGQPSQGRPTPKLEKAYEQQNRQNQMQNAANSINQNGYQNQGYGNQQQNYTQQSFPGTDPMANHYPPITDNDLPF